jgi:hypothetical protein
MANRTALVAAVDGLEGRWAEAAAGFRDAWSRFRDLGVLVGLAVSQLDALSVGPSGDPMLETAAREAREILERVGATAYLAQLDALEARHRTTSTGAAPQDRRLQSIEHPVASS